MSYLKDELHGVEKAKDEKMSRLQSREIFRVKNEIYGSMGRLITFYVEVTQLYHYAIMEWVLLLSCYLVDAITTVVRVQGDEMVCIPVGGKLIELAMA
ncbi:hypothetical protein LXL04_007826 [Taraxacum kok-saghyz]